MQGRDSGAWIVFNGEIYNYRELQAELSERGYSFLTGTDTEVLLAAYEEWGSACLSRFCGMFAFAIWDPRDKTLFCARDRLGIKPFYYAVTSDGLFLFASEIKALLAHPDVPRDLDHAAITGFISHGNCDFGSQTLFRGIHSLEAGHSLRLRLHDAGSLKPQRYWTIEARTEAGQTDQSAIDELRELLLRVMEQHLISDVPIGSCLSGGLDSSAIVGSIGHIQATAPDGATAVGQHLRTFTSCWPLPDYDERDYALGVARSVGADPHLIFPKSDEFWADFDHLSWHQDMPIGSLSFYAQWRVMQAAREGGVKVLLDGQGGDEVFGGYAKFRYAYLVSLAASGQTGRFAREGWATLQMGDRYVLDLRKGHRYLPPAMKRLLGVNSFLSQVMNREAVPAGSGTSDSTPASRWWAALKTRQNGGWSLMQRSQIDDLLLDTLPQLLRFEDRSSMAFSLEARVPLLDHRLVEYGVNLPDRLKFNGGWSKYALRSAVTGLIPPSIQWRKTKLGFAAPNKEWIAHDLADEVIAVLSSPMRCERYVDRGRMLEWYLSPRRQRAGTESILGLFRVLALESWMRAFDLSPS